MAGDWIKLEHATLDKPEIAIAAEVLGMSPGEAFYLFIRYWVWLDQNLDESRSGLVPFVSRKSLERKFNCPGFAAILERIQWASFDDEQQILSVINWERHNGKTAKSRALEQRKKANQRAELSRSCPDVVPVVAGPEKRREEKRVSQEQSQRLVRASRLPADWQLPEEWKNWAVTVHHLEPTRVVRISLIFRDHFLGAPNGKGGLKVDWFATWRKWIAKEMHDA